MRECVSDFVWIYHGVKDLEPSDTKIVSHLEYGGKSNVVSWIKPGDHFKVDELNLKGIRLVKSNNANK